jgi:hypothetical protein
METFRPSFERVHKQVGQIYVEVMEDVNRELDYGTHTAKASAQIQRVLPLRKDSNARELPGRSTRARLYCKEHALGVQKEKVSPLERLSKKLEAPKNHPRPFNASLS